MLSMNILDRYTVSVQNYLANTLDKEHFLYRKSLYHFGFIDEAGKDRERIGWGKGLRCTLVLLMVEPLKGNLWEQAIPAAAAVELFHNATLIVDDWQDKDKVRRGIPAVWTLADVGPEQAVNIAFFLTTLSSKVLEDLPDVFVPEIRFKVHSLFEQTKIAVIEGQQQDIAFEQQQEIELDEYLDMAMHKTGVLIQTALLMGALLAEADAQTLTQVAELGNVFGRLFQMQDDFLGVYGNITETGKPAEDILHKKKSLPVVLAMKHATGLDKESLIDIYKSKEQELSPKAVAKVMGLFETLHIKEKMKEMIEKKFEEAQKIIAGFRFSKKDEFLYLADLIAHRDK